MFIWIFSMLYFFFCFFNWKRRNKKSQWVALIVSIIAFFAIGAFAADDPGKNSTVDQTQQDARKNKQISSETKRAKASKLAAAQESKKKDGENKQSIQKTEESRKTGKTAKQEPETHHLAPVDKSDSQLADAQYQGTQTINVNSGVPTFTETDMSLKNGAWERYGDLDHLNRATSAEAMLNQTTMPKNGEKRGSIADVTPTGWKNKKITSGYLFNRSHLIGWALSAENDNWKNLITGTRQLNSPEMLRFEMDVKTYLEQNKDNYVRYTVTPVFRGNELLARGVHMMARSVKDSTISFNVYIFNVQDGVKLNYADGSSYVANNNGKQASSPNSEQTKEINKDDDQSTMVFVTPTGSKYHRYPHGRGNFTKITLRDAKARGLQPCKICQPPN